MPPPRRPDRRPLTRADLPAELTPATLRHVDLGTLRRLARPGNGVLDADEQRRFDAALGELRRETTALVDESLLRARRGGPGDLDPTMRRSYQRAQQRLAAQAEQARTLFPPVPTDPSPDPSSGATPTPDADAGVVGDAGDDVSPATLEQEVEQTSETLTLLEKIASLEQQQLEHQRNQSLAETRGLFFAFLVSVAVIVAGVAPLVEAGPHDRLLIVVGTVAVTAVAGVAYAVVRAVQTRTS